MQKDKALLIRTKGFSMETKELLKAKEDRIVLGKQKITMKAF